MGAELLSWGCLLYSLWGLTVTWLPHQHYFTEEISLSMTKQGCMSSIFYFYNAFSLSFFIFILPLFSHFVDPQLENQDLTNVDTCGNKVYPEFPI